MSNEPTFSAEEILGFVAEWKRLYGLFNKLKLPWRDAESIPVLGDGLLRVQAETRFIQLTHAIAQVAVQLDIDPTPLFHVTNNLAYAEARVWDNAKALVDHVQLKLGISASVQPPKKQTTKDEANAAVREYLQRTNPDAGVRELAKAIGCSIGTINKTVMWKAVHEARKQGRKPKNPKTVSLTPQLERIIGKDDDQLEKLVREQQQDSEPSPLDENPEVTVYRRASRQ